MQQLAHVPRVEDIQGEILVHEQLDFARGEVLKYKDHPALLGHGTRATLVGLIEAARSFDGSKGNKFITYAMWWVRKYILKAIDDHSSHSRGSPGMIAPCNSRPSDWTSGRRQTILRRPLQNAE